MTHQTKYKECPECFGRGWNYSRFSTATSEPCIGCLGTGRTVGSVIESIPLEKQIAELRTEILELRKRIEVLEQAH